MTVLETIKALLGPRGACSQASRATGIDYSTVYRIREGRIPNPGLDKVEKLAAHFGLGLGISANVTPQGTESNTPNGVFASEGGTPSEIKA